MVVPGRVVAACVVAVEIVLEPITTTELMTSAGNVVGSTVVAGIVMVYVTCAPKLLAGMALPIPALVYGVGSVRVDVLGLSAGLGYTLPVIPFLRV